MRTLIGKAWRLAAAAALVAPALVWADVGGGLAVPQDPLAWSRWQARVGFNASAPLWRADLARGETSGLKVQGLSLISDYYFAAMPFGTQGSGGFRASSGILLGAGAPLWASQTPSAVSTFALGRRNLGLLSSGTGIDPSGSENATVPYLGVGYSGLSARGGISFAADVGLLAQGGSGLRFGRLLSGTQSVDDLLRDLRLTPVLQLGVSYSF